ncbi:ABC transporter permease [Microbacterium sp. SORGH_AS_0888]|uniref:ABC transporter permease n=1 Tax=Microbacterium sp. SORGH_AS_0888 TaxID=3041791 RepID=UPI00277DD29E|nr:ABC transporter permease subunit [Microbacterium sp. SORGH_AS_0888]MDQ1130480.1 ABC-type nitrate/sulfonate/bicarbonate transport system permease component [Microbacterium sp. SORGH_AS_0888]
MRASVRYTVVVVFYAAVLVLWQAAGQAVAAPGAVLIPPSEIVATLLARSRAIFLVSGVTLTEAGVGFAIGVASAVVLAVVVDRFRLVGDALYRLALVLYAIPVIAIAAPLTAWLGLGIAAKIAVAALAAYFPVLVNVTGALRTLDPRIEELGRVLAIGYTRRLVSLRAPAILPALLSSFKIAAPAAFIGALIAEWMGAESGLGVMLLQSMFSFNVPLLWTVLLVTTALNGLIVLLFSILERVSVPWHGVARGGTA